MNRNLYGDVHPRVAASWESFGGLRQMQLRYAESVSDFQHALSIYERWYGKESGRRVECLVYLGQALMSEGQLDRARTTLDEAVNNGARVLGDTDSVMMLALNILGTLEQRTARFDAARAHFERLVSVAQMRYGKDSYMVGFGLANLASLELATDHYQKAEGLYRQALKALREHLPANHPDIGMVEMNLGKTLWKERKYAEAETSLTAGIDIVSKGASPR